MRAPSSRPRQRLALSPRARRALSPRARRALSPRALRFPAGACSPRTSRAVAGPSSSPRRGRGILLPRSLRLAALDHRRRSKRKNRQICLQDNLNVAARASSLSLHQTSLPDVSAPHNQDVFVPRHLNVAALASSLSPHQPSIPDVPAPHNQACWSSLPEEILHYICSMVTIKTIARMKICCRHWCHNTVTILSADTPMWFCVQNDKMLFYLAKEGYKFSTQHNLDLPPKIQYYSSLGFLVTIVGQKYSILVLNLATCTLTYTPRLANHLIEQVISWETQDDQVQTLAVSSHAGSGYFSVSVLRKMSKWITTTYRCPLGLHLSTVSAPVILNNSVYVLGMDCEIAIFGIDNQMMRFLPVKSCCSIRTYQVCHLMVVNNDILAVVTDVQHSEAPMILKLNMEHQIWEMTRSLGGFSLYSGSPSSVAVEGSCMKDSLTLAALRNDCSAVEVKVRCENGAMFFLVDNCVPVQPSLDFSTWFLDQEGVSMTNGNADSLKSGAGTWIKPEFFIRPSISRKHENKEIDDYTDSDIESHSDISSQSDSDSDINNDSYSDTNSDSDSDSGSDSCSGSKTSIGPLENPKNRSNNCRHDDRDSDIDTESDADSKGNTFIGPVENPKKDTRKNIRSSSLNCIRNAFI